MLHNPLDILFRDIKRQLYEERRETEGHLPPARPIRKPEVSTYAKPENWSPGLVVRLVHSTDGPVGTFREWFHSSAASCRRLLPCDASLAVDRDEVVFGDYWLHPHFQGPAAPQDTDQEILEIQRRFAELMLELPEEESF